MQVETKVVKISEVKPNPDNPRIIKDDSFKKLVKSLQDFPEMLDIRELVVDETMTVLGGNMRLKALLEVGEKKVRVKIVSGLTEEQKKEFIIKDNLAYGSWDWDMLANNWDEELLSDWGLDTTWEDDSAGEEEGEETVYSDKVEIPIYVPEGEKPELKDTYDMRRYNEIVERIESSNLSEEEKQYLKVCASRHIVFNYAKIADLYAHSDKNMQSLMEDSALVIIDFKQAIKNGLVRLSENIKRINEED